MAALAGLLVFLLFASGYLPQLQALNIWVLSGLPLLVWVLAFGARAYFFGGALDHYQFLHEQAEAVLRSWQQWAQRSLVVHARCVLLPDQVSARVLVQGKDNLPARQGQALRIAGLPTCVQARAHTGLRLLLAAMEAIFQKLQPGQTLHVTLLSDVPPDQYEALRSAWQHQWSAVMPHWPAVTLALSAELPYQWIEEKLKSGCPALELIVVLQMEGGAAYSDGLAVLLLGPDGLVQAANLPVQGCLSRPMSLETDKLESELPLFLQTQANMGQVTTLLADSVDWQTLNSKVLAISNAEGVPLSAEQLWILESLCGSPGPFSSWLTAALAVEMTEHQGRTLLVLSKGSGRSWISTVTTGEPRCNA
ncbi:hypothetical protein AB3464_27775 [Pseudomonas asplenii]|uniref:Uncharacterized protein n=1 Tax=Pseudomonas asplenii TaxID=53407 RepID=A0A1H6NYE2_9PSED|nr:hypothetical protein [Pseudomonas fuscovaginae]SEI18076.1 hypothetical protein SAMN05216581_3541 [Pseudomonas fuscovaginae]